ncbi:MAG TPA: hypothetical protein VFM93_02420, partial [Candidatus Limnocylindria bacterium]|nr:hypothetical protein [Candidatus Limnocylindria bacterium]
KLRELVAAQGGDARAVDDPGLLPRAPTVTPLRAGASAYVKAIAADRIGLASVRLGAGREKKGDRVDLAAGIVLCAKVGDRVERGETYAEVHSSSSGADAVALVRDAFTWSRARVAPRRLVLGRIGGAS